MKSDNAAHLPDEHFVTRVDGRVKSHHRRFLDALGEGLQLRDQFPQHDVKVKLLQATDQQRTALHQSAAEGSLAAAICNAVVGICLSQCRVIIPQHWPEPHA